jgi:hypothetical protein
MTVSVTSVQIIAGAEIKPWNRIAAKFPIDQVAGFQYGDSGKNKHGRRHEVIDVIHEDDIGIREIRSNHGIPICAIAIITLHFYYILLLTPAVEE